MRKTSISSCSLPQQSTQNWLRQRVYRSLRAIPLLVSSVAVLSGCQTMSEIDKGLYAAAESVSSRDTVTGLRTLSTQKRAEQIRIGNQVAEQQLKDLAASKSAINTNLDIKAYLRVSHIFERVKAVSHMRDEKWTVILMPGDSVNAFVTGGTYVFVNLYTATALSDDEIAGILGHEIGHVSANQIFERETTRLAAAVTGSNHNDARKAAYSRLDEAEADRIGILYAALAGYSPHEVPGLWQKLAQQSGGERSYLASHPAPEDRLVATREMAGRVAEYYTQGRQNKDFEAVLACNSLWCAQKDVAKAGEGGGLLAVLEAAGNTYVQGLNAKTEQRRQEALVAQQEVLRQQQIAMNQSAQQFLRAVSVQPSGPTAVTMAFEWTGNVSLKDISIIAHFFDAKGATLQRVGKLPGPIQPRQRFGITFDLSGINVSSLSMPSTRWVVQQVSFY